MQIIVYSDAARFSVAGPCGWACAVEVPEEDGRRRIIAQGVIETSDIRRAELHAAVRGVAVAAGFAPHSILVIVDRIDLPNLVAKPVFANSPLADLRTELVALTSGIAVRWEWAKRSSRTGNSRVNQLARAALTEHLRTHG